MTASPASARRSMTRNLVLTALMAALTVLTPESIGRLCPFLTAAGCAAGAAIGGVCLPILRRLLLPNGEKPHGYPDAGID